MLATVSVALLGAALMRREKNDLTDVNLMFKAIVETKSHEGGLLAPFTGSSPALGSIIVRVDDGTYIGKIDAVLGNTDSLLPI